MASNTYERKRAVTWVLRPTILAAAGLIVLLAALLTMLWLFFNAQAGSGGRGPGVVSSQDSEKNSGIQSLLPKGEGEGGRQALASKGGQEPFALPDGISTIVHAMFPGSNQPASNVAVLCYIAADELASTNSWVAGQTTDVEGRAQFFLESGQRYQFQASLEGRVGVASVYVDSSSKEVQVLLWLQRLSIEDVLFEGVVVDQENGAPIPDAQVKSLPDAEGGAAIAATTDQDGRFRCEVDPDGALLRICAPGYASRLYYAEYGSLSPGHNVVRLVGGAALKFHTPSASPLSLEVRISELQAEVARGADGAVRGAGPTRAWVEPVMDGMCLIRDLPSGVPLLCDLIDTNTRSLVWREEMILSPGELRETHWGAAGTIIRGQVNSPEGRHGRNCRVVMYPRTPVQGERLRLFRPIDGSVIRECRSDEVGQFRFDAVEPGAYWIAAYEATEIVDEAVPRAVGVPVDVSDGESEIILNLEYPELLPLTGYVYGYDGKPRASCGVTVASEELVTTILVSTDGSGSFDLGGLPAGEYTVTVADPTTGDVQEVVARAGDAPVRIAFERPGYVGGRVVQGGGLAADGLVVLSGVDGRYRRVRYVGGRFECAVAPGAYWLIAYSDEGYAGSYGSLQVAPGQRLEDLVVTVQPACRVRIRCGGPLSQYQIYWNGYRCGIEFGQLGEERVQFLPPGRIDVRRIVEGREAAMLSGLAAMDEELELDFAAE